MSRSAITVLVWLFILTGCSSSHSAKVHQITPPTNPAITRADDGKTFTLRVGQTIAIYLQGRPWTDADVGGDYWTPLNSDTSGVVKISSIQGGYPAYSESALLTGIKPGTIALGAGHGVECLFFKHPCVPPMEGFSITIRVT